MRPQRQQVFRTDAASKLEDLEIVTALLERDVVNGRAFIDERGVLLPRGRVRKRRPRRANIDLTAKTTKYLRTSLAGIARLALDRRLHAGVAILVGFIVDLAIVLSCAGLVVAALASLYLFV